MLKKLAKSIWPTDDTCTKFDVEYWDGTKTVLTKEQLESNPVIIGNEYDGLRAELTVANAALEKLKAENERYRDRLQISPQGDDKIDELEAAMEYLKFKLKTMQKCVRGANNDPA